MLREHCLLQADPLRALAGLASIASAGLGGAPASPLNTRIGPHRRFAWAEADLERFKAIKGALGGTVNDVVLAAITHGFRELLLSRGESTDRVLRTLVPVSVRRPGERGTYNNRVSAMFAELPVSLEDPVERTVPVRPFAVKERTRRKLTVRLPCMSREPRTDRSARAGSMSASTGPAQRERMRKPVEIRVVAKRMRTRPRRLDQLHQAGPGSSTWSAQSWREPSGATRETSARVVVPTSTPPPTLSTAS